jgi:hypothetical protein
VPTHCGWASEILHQLKTVLYPIIYRVSTRFNHPKLVVYRISQPPTVGRRLSKKSFGPRIQWLPVACAIGSHGVLQEDPSEKMTFLAKRRDATSSAAEVGKMRMVLYGFLWFSMVLYGFICFYMVL